jgi:rhamnogalacturonan endolyase
MRSHSRREPGCSTRARGSTGLDQNVIAKWNWQSQSLDPLLVAHQCTSNNGTKATPALSADIWGDWREEVIWRTPKKPAIRFTRD